MTESTTYWLAAIPLAAAGLAWLLNQFTTFLTLHLADRRTLRETLYVLLELRHTLRVAQGLRDTAKATQFFFAALAHRLPGLALTGPQRQQLSAMVQQLLPTIEAQVVRDVGLPERYAATLLKLASVAPFQAYRLRGKDSLLSLVNNLVQHTAEALRQQASSLAELTRQQRLPPPTPPLTRTVHLTAGLAELEQVMLALASRVGGREQRELQRLLAEDEPAADLVAQRIMEAGVAFLLETVAQQLAEE